MAKNRDNVMTITELPAYLKISQAKPYKLAQEGARHARWSRASGRWR